MTVTGRRQATLFDDTRQTMTESIEETVLSLNAYAANYDHWAIAYSGGKDSSAVASLVPQLIANGQVPAPKSLTVLYADTRLELPPLHTSAMTMLEKLRSIGCECKIVLPPVEERFLVYMLGRGVPPPSNTFRWCTAKIKIEPMMKALEELRNQYDQKFLMLTGVRVGESAQRDARIALSCGKNGAECGQGWFQETTPEHVADTLAPLLHWRVCNVWKWLRIWAPQAGFPTQLVADAYGGDEAEEINARTGCVGCNLASRDTALETILKNERWEYLSPLLELRDLWAELKKPHSRLRKPTGERTKSGRLSLNQNRMGPLTMDARRLGMQRIIDIQGRVNERAREVGDPPYILLNEEEIQAIERMIDANTWPNKWTGDEPRADAGFFTEIFRDGSSQDNLFGTWGN